MYGSHLSIAGGPHNALRQARELGMDCVQIFTANQRQWRAKPLSAETLEQWHVQRREAALADLVGHDSYLINLASPDPALWQRSMAAFREELLRCEALGLSCVVAHPGAHMGAGESAGLQRVAGALDHIHRDLPGLAVRTCLEITAGQGTSLGWRLEHLKTILDSVAQPQRLAICLDTAHLLAGGYDLTSAAGMRGVIDEVQAVLGLEWVRVVHVNDSRVVRGARVDRHAHIGQGHVSLDAFGVLVNHPHFAGIPKILETPKEKTPDGEEWDAVNLRILRGVGKK